MDVEAAIKAARIRQDDAELREKNLRTIFEFMTDEDDAATGVQRDKRLSRHTLYTADGSGCRFGAGYTYTGPERLKERDEVTVRRFPVFYTVDMQVFQSVDPNVFMVTGLATGDQYDDEGNFVMNHPPTPMHNLFIMQDGRIKEYVEYCQFAIKFPHDEEDIEKLKASGQGDQIRE